MSNGRVSGKVAIVTGAASGLGYAIAAMLAREGAAVTLTDVNEAAGHEAAARIGNGARFVHQDVVEEAGWKALIADTVARDGGLHILVNNAGIGLSPGKRDPEHAPLEQWQRINKVNGEGVFLGCKYAIPAMRDSGGGSIVNLSSIAALVATPFLTAYGFSKAGVAQLTKSVALYCAQGRTRIRCNSVHPGQIYTPMLDSLFDELSAEHGITRDQAKDAFLTKIPMGELGEPDDIAHAVLYLASDEAKHVTGTQLVVDGGMNLNP